ncbi:MAG: hypothetical protein WBH44_02975 [Proteocatella sp.]
MSICAELSAVKSPIKVFDARRQWFSEQAFAKNFGFEVVDTTNNGSELLALSFDGTMPNCAK